MGSISKHTLQRLPTYLAYLKSLPCADNACISAAAIAAALELGEVQVRKDLSAVGSAGKPRIGYPVNDLIQHLEYFLGYSTRNRAVLVGVGNLGLALLSYGGFADYGLDIVGAFDSNPALIGLQIDGRPVLSMDELPTFCQRENVQIGILAVPSAAAQPCCDALIAGGVRAVWNFAPVHLKAPDGVLIQRENMASSLALLSYHLKQPERN
ncbi:MAG: redox-sensing transcriptional repressor Rex [Eubacteriales bacterium]|nr:redox-sensing transcriptional repressor Rex [Eubacteriales bacterium]